MVWYGVVWGECMTLYVWFAVYIIVIQFLGRVYFDVIVN